MRYLITEMLEEDIRRGLQNNAGGKARDDFRNILMNNETKEIVITVREKLRGGLSPLKKAYSHIEIKDKWLNSLESLSKGDFLYVQYPIRDHTVLGGSIFKKLSKRGVCVVLLIHDLNILRDNKRDIGIKKKIRYYLEEVTMLKSCSYIIAHNEQMIDALVKQGIQKEKIISLGIFDYLAKNSTRPESEKIDTNGINYVAVAGNLSKQKAGYVYKLPEGQIGWNIYGMNYTGNTNENIHYYGAFSPEELPCILKGDFGLVWDGDSANTCSGAYGEYLKINNPHKTSLYLAAGIPVIIWKEAALARFIEKNRCGITIESLDEISDVIRGITESENKIYKDSARELGEKIRNGFYTLQAVQKVESMKKDGENR